MKFIRASLFLIIGLGLIAAPAYAQSTKTDKEIIQILIQESLAEYKGPCPCPENIMRNGDPCGGFSAWSKKGGAEPLCYKTDVTREMIENYKKRKNPEEKKS